MLHLKGFGIERARLGTFRGFGTERARLGTFRGLGTERARLGPFRGLGTTRLAIFYQNLRFPAFSKKSQKTVIFLLKKSTQPPKNVKFCIKKVSFFTQKEHPASQKTEFLHEKMTKK